jgi:hypothetical protein
MDTRQGPALPYEASQTRMVHRHPGIHAILDTTLSVGIAEMFGQQQ